MIARKILILLIVVAISSFAKEEILFANGENVKTKLEMPEEEVAFENMVDKTDFFLGEDYFKWNRNGNYILMRKWNVGKEFYGDGHFASFLPANTRSMVMYYIPPVPCESGPGMGKCRECLKNNVLKNNKPILKKCRRDVHVSDSLYKLVNAFFIENRKSLVDDSETYLYSKTGESCFHNLFMLSQNKAGKRKFFDMVPPGCIDNEMKKNKIIDEYIYLYDQFYSIFHSNFEECRWENFGDKKQLDKCLSY